MVVLARDWEGETAFVLAGGPSVLDLDLSPLKGRRVIAVNSAHLTWPEADAVFYADSDWWTQIGSKEPPFAGEFITTCALGGPKDRPITRLIKVEPGRGISTDPRKASISATSVSGAINVLVHRGVARIVLLGVDGRLGPDGRRHHHDGRYPNPVKKGGFDRHRKELEALAPSIARLGVEVINCSPVSHVTCWPKMSLEAALNVPVRNLTITPAKPSISLLSMYGMGDCLHQRAVVREMMKTHRVELQTYYTAMYHDLEAEGLKVTLVSGKLDPRIRDGGNGADRSRPNRQFDRKIGYDHAATKRHGTLLAAMFGSVGLALPERPDFSLPVKPEWRSAARKLVGDTGGKPIMVYRPIVLNGTWPCPSRAPDPGCYADLYRSIREKFFTVSVCDLTQKGEHIVGEEQDADLKLYHGEAPFETLAGLFAEAALVFGNAGFTPILAQAVGTPNICVYGGNESFRFTNVVGKHLAPTLPIEPAKPCECFERHHNCDKAIDLVDALPKVRDFAATYAKQPKVLIFATTYADRPEKARLVGQWVETHGALNPGCDLLLVDSASPDLGDWLGKADVYRFPDNIGHLARGGRDGWGRAFCKGLERAIDGQYDYVAHIEGDSLLKQPVLPIVRRMIADGIQAASVPVSGTKRQERGWAETGLMFFSVEYLWQSKFIERYAWQDRQPKPYPEQAIFDLLGHDLTMLELEAERGDKGQITAENAAGFDWITHCPPEAFDAFVDAAMPRVSIEATVAWEQAPRVKLNFGCGTNHLDGWQNFDAEVDIEKPLPFADASADFVYAEHVVEHVDYLKAIAFFRECLRVLKPGGIVRICVPSLENIWRRGDQEYFDFTRRWAPSADRRGAMHAIIHAHGHKAIWSQALLEACLFLAGFDDIAACEVHKSAHADLAGVEGHHKVIGEHFNWIEAAIAEGKAP